MSGTRDNVLEELQERLGYRFTDVNLLREAITHKSFAHEAMGELCPYNERLEFLGDAVIGLAITDLLMDSDDSLSEGELSKLKAALVSGRTLSRLSRMVGLGDFVLLGKGEELGQGRHKDSILAGAYEAVIGAVYRDGGYSCAFGLVERHFAQVLRDSRSRPLDRDFKGELQVRVQRLFKQVPEYVLVRESGPPHRRVFDVELRIGERVWGTGRGQSKKEAEQKAAEEALSRVEAADSA
jgi:ribonuclease-3